MNRERDPRSAKKREERLRAQGWALWWRPVVRYQLRVSKGEHVLEVVGDSEAKVIHAAYEGLKERGWA